LKCIVSVNFAGRKLASIPVTIRVTLSNLKGKVQFRYYPYPSNKYSLSFHEEPEMDLVVELSLGYRFKLSNLVQKLEQYMTIIIKAVFIEQFVRPNRMYFRIPFTKEKSFEKKLGLDITTTDSPTTQNKNVDLDDDEIAKALEAQMDKEISEINKLKKITMNVNNSMN